jgi:hypothetical protein
MIVATGITEAATRETMAVRGASGHSERVLA